ncbi:MAG: patatin-like phospholipase family protein, partial [Burkholderiales bacterium]
MNIGSSSTRALVGALATIAVMWIGVGHGAEPDSPARTHGVGARPKICLVLSGGGARGAAHIGVLKVLEELRIPIHCITGTSMGALVGAAYATGMNVHEMDVITSRITTELLFNEQPPRRERSMRRKQDDFEPYVTPDIGYAEGNLVIAKGLVSGVQLETVLRELSKVKGFHRFDELPIQFRAVATDLVTGKAVVFDQGELANVMRASMAVPGAVAPAEFDGMMLVDGMLTENLPVETARRLGAEVIIAVNVGSPLLNREQLIGIRGVVSQMLSILTEQNVQESLAKLTSADILITPELAEYTTADFDKLAQIAPLGEAAARKAAARLASLALPPAEYAALRKQQQVEVAADVRPVDEIRFAPLRHVNPRT